MGNKERSITTEATLFQIGMICGASNLWDQGTEP